MFLHLFKYRIKTLLHSKVVMFWSLIYPIILASLFFAAFGSGIGKSSMETISVAVVKDQSGPANDAFLESIEAAEYGDNEKMFNVTTCSEAEAKNLLIDDKVTGIVILSDEIRLVVSKSGMSESILSQFCDTVKRYTSLVEQAARENPEMVATVMAEIQSESSRIKSVSLGGESQEGEMQYFYSIIAMACLFGSFIGVVIGQDVQANGSKRSARKTLSAAPRSKMIVTEMLAGVLINFVEVMLVYAFISFVLGLPLAEEPLLFMVIALFGSLIGVCSGQFIACIARGRDSMQIGISLTLSLGSCFLGGLMFADMKNIIEETAPIVNRINPSALLTDAIFSLAVYSDYRRFTVNIIILAVEAALLVTVSFLSVRKAKVKSY